MKPVENNPELKSLCESTPGLREHDVQNLQYQRLGGLTNRVFHIRGGDDDFILRLAGEGTEEYIDRRVESHNAQVAASAGVSAEVLFVDENKGLMLSRFLAATETMTAELFRQRPGAPARAAHAFKTLHECDQEFEFEFRLFDMIDDYRSILAGKNAELPAGYAAVVEEALLIKTHLDNNPVALKPCHCDPLCENFLDNGKRMWIVDWEYSGMNDPYWDLADLSVEAGFNKTQDEEMMSAYEGGNIADSAMARMVIYKAMCDLLWTLWGLIQHVNNNPAEDFWAYGVNRFERCQRLMNEQGFQQHVTRL